MIQLSAISRAATRPRVARWLARDHVRQWWGDPEFRITQFDETPTDQHALIDSDGAPVGYVRWQPVDRATLDSIGLTTIPDGAIDADMFIGEPDALGHGYGPAALSCLVTHLTATTSAPMIGLCTSTDNARAIRAFQNAGFAQHCEYDDPTFGPCHVMTLALVRS